MVRARIDLHRLELYEKLGVRDPNDFTDECETLGPAVSGTLLYGYPLPDLFMRPKAEDDLKKRRDEEDD